MHPTDNKRAFQNALLKWFATEGKDYPWRRTENPWHILVSEVMLQQTLVKTVLRFYDKFLTQFPTPIDLAKAPEQDILSAWEGLGYYRRVRNLQKAAKAIADHHMGEFPRDYDAIRALPGIGQYTAGAVSSFAYNDSQPIVDANVARVFARLFDYHERVDSTAGLKQLWAWAAELVPAKSALMELGQTYCSNKSPNCTQCPVRKFCQTSTPEELPQKKPKRSTVLVDEFCLFYLKNDQILLSQEASGKRREGMWKLPERSYEEVNALPLLTKSTYAITHHKVTLRIYQPASAPRKLQPGEQWHPIDQLPQLPMPSPFRKAVSALVADVF